MSVRDGVQSVKGERLIVVDAVTSHGPLRHELLTVPWAYKYNKEGDYHNAMNFDKFQRWINDYYRKASFLVRSLFYFALPLSPWRNDQPLFHVKQRQNAQPHYVSYLVVRKKFQCRNGDFIQFKLPTVSESFAKPPPVDLLRMS